MTERTLFAVGDMRETLAAAQGWRCAKCKRSLSEGFHLAHRIPQKKRFMRLFSPRVIHHRRNLAAVCSLECNDALDIGSDPMAVNRLALEIKKDLTSGK